MDQDGNHADRYGAEALSRRELLKRGVGLSIGLGAAVAAGSVAERAAGGVLGGQTEEDFRGVTIRVVTRPNFDDGVRNQRVLEAIEKSAASRRWVAVP